MESITINSIRQFIHSSKSRTNVFKSFGRHFQTSSYLSLSNNKTKDLCKDDKRSVKTYDTIASPQTWLSRFLIGPKPDPSFPRKSHSSLLSDSPFVYEIVTHDAKPGERERYLKLYEEYAKEVKKSNPEVDLLGSWKVFYNSRDQAVHLWRYSNGDIDVDRMIEAYATSASLKAADREVALLLNHRKNVLAKSFSYWGEPEPRKPSNIYEMRIYTLKPGRMIEWGNAWATGITYRRAEKQDVGGFFTKIGSMYTVYHLWAYKSLVHRNEIRQRTWERPGWAQTVSFTVPLIKWSESKMMVPTDFSQLK